MSLFSVLPHKLMTPLSVVDTTMVFSVQVNPSKLSGRIGRCALGKTVYCQCRVHHKRIMSNIILLLSSSSVLKSNELQRQPPKLLFNDILHYNDVCTEF